MKETSQPEEPQKIEKEPEKVEKEIEKQVNKEPQNNDKPKEEEKKDAKLFEVETHHDSQEVIDRLLNVKELEQNISGLWSWMSGSVSKVAESASKVAESASKVVDKAEFKNIANQVAEKAEKVKNIATQQANELASSVTKVMEEQQQKSEKLNIVVSTASLPWDTAHPERRAEARDRVLKLSMDDHTFTVPPPKEANFKYDQTAREPFATRMLDTDALLSAKRFKLVPKTVDEHDFWRNYFYRVDLILNALGVPSTIEKSEQQNEQTTTKEVLHENPSNQDWEEEMRKEIAAAEASHLNKEDENFDMLEDEMEFEDDGELANSIKELQMQ